MNDPVSHALTTPGLPTAASGPGSHDISGDVAVSTGKLVRSWVAQAGPLADWLLQGRDASEKVGYRDRCQRLTAAMVDRLNEFRRGEWLVHLLTRKDPWGNWIERETSRVYEVSPPEEEADKMLRTAAALRPDDLLELQQLFTHNSNQYKQLGRYSASATLAGIEAVLPEVDPGAEVVRAAARKTSTFLQQSVTRLPAPPSPAAAVRLRECLKTLLSPPDLVWGWGCLNWDYEVRLFQCFPRITAPYLSEQDFERLQTAIKELRDWTTAPAGKSADWLLDLLRRLGQGASRLAPILVGRPGQSQHRLWAAHLLENFRRLGELAGYALPELEEPAVRDSIPSEQPGNKEAETAIEQAPGTLSPDNPGTAPSPPPPAVPKATAPAPSVEKPPPNVPAEERGPLPDTRLAQLVREYPEHVGAIEKIGQLAAMTSATCTESWQQAAEALEGLRAKCQQHREWLLSKTAELTPSALDPKIKQRTVALSDELLNNLKQLDRLLPGEGEDGPLSPQEPAHLKGPQRQELCRRVSEVRTLLFGFMQRHGGYRLYEVRIGESTIRHNGKLNLAVPREVAAPRTPPACIAQILQPGYVVERAGKREVKEYPCVRLAK